jgi:flagellar basal body-associated protein FliL|tara:strand:- start:186 stop:428 length:243 start_codon:yes stop_codon:yes gene_type:complete
MGNKKGSVLVWILIVLILLVIGLVIYFVVLDNNINFKDFTSSEENIRGSNSQSQGVNEDDTNGGFFKKESIPQPPALPSG